MDLLDRRVGSDFDWPDFPGWTSGRTHFGTVYARDGSDVRVGFTVLHGEVEYAVARGGWTDVAKGFAEVPDDLPAFVGATLSDTLRVLGDGEGDPE